jgi:hypothetical protein
MLESDLQKESCSRSKIIVVNRSNKARSSLLKEPKRVNPRGMKVAQLQGLLSVEVLVCGLCIQNDSIKTWLSFHRFTVQVVELVYSIGSIDSVICTLKIAIAF